MQPIPQGPPPGMPPFIHVPARPQGSSPDLEAKLTDIVGSLRDAVGSPDATPVVALDLQKAVMAVQKVLADFHKEHQAALGGGPATNFLRRVSGSGG